LPLEILLGFAIVAGFLYEDCYLYSFLGLIGAMVMFVTIFKPHFGYLLLIFLMPFRSEQYQIAEFGGAIVRVADILVLPVSIGWLLHTLFIAKDRRFLGKTNLDTPLVVFAWLAMISFAWSVARFGTIAMTLQMIYAFLLFYMSVDLIRTRRFFYVVLMVWILSGVVTGAESVYQSYITPSERVIGGSVTIIRETGLQTNAIELGEFVNYPLMLAVGLYLISKRAFRKILIILAILAMIMAHVTSVARGPVLGLAAGLALFALLSHDFRRFITRELLIALLVGASVTLLFSYLAGFDLFGYVDQLIQKFETAIENPTSDPGVLFRLYVWGALFEIILTHPLLGVGFGGVAEALGEATAPFGLEAPHNLYLMVLGELGIIGLGVLLWIMIRLCRIIGDSLKTTSDKVYKTLIVAFAAALATKLVGGLTWGYFIQDRSLWLLLGLGMAMIHLAHSEQQAEIGTSQPVAEP
jgi:O-antigen ligase